MRTIPMILRMVSFSVIVGLAFSAWGNDEPETPNPPPSSDNQVADNDSDDEEDSWIFDPGTYTNDPKTGNRVWQYAKERPVYLNVSLGQTYIGHWYYTDPFFTEPYDRFYDESNDRFFADVAPGPVYLPTLYSGPFGGSNTFYGLDTAGYHPFDGDPNDG